MICALSEWLWKNKKTRFFFFRWLDRPRLCAGSFQLRTSSPAVSISALLYLYTYTSVCIFAVFRIGRRGNLHMKSPVVVISITSLISSYLKSRIIWIIAPFKKERKELESICVPYAMRTHCERFFLYSRRPRPPSHIVPGLRRGININGGYEVSQGETKLKADMRDMSLYRWALPRQVGRSLSLSV